jgi:hypothetical protein
LNFIIIIFEFQKFEYFKLLLFIYLSASRTVATRWRDEGERGKGKKIPPHGEEEEKPKF